MSRTTRVFLFSVLCFFVFVAFASGQARPPAADKNAPSANPQSTNPPVASALSSEGSQYLGAETCKTCHEEIYNAWEKTPHWKTTLNKEGGPSKQGCEGCHGPGAAHVAGGGDKTKIFVFEGKSRQETSTRCLSCHGEAHEQSHFAESAHSSSDVGCLDCHDPHHAKDKQHLLVQNQPQLCYTCHTSAKADFAKPYHHRVNEVWCNALTATTRMGPERSFS
jgi:predicted CXXCH cytochrome family protein